MPSTKHHYVPQSHLRRFAANAAGEMFVYRKGARKNPFLKQPKGQGFGRDLYSVKTPDGGHDSGIEDSYLARIDDFGAKACSRLPAGDLEADAAAFALYLASLTLRNPQAIEVTGKIGDALGAEVYRRLYFNDAEFRKNLRASVESDEEFERMMEACHPDHTKITANRKIAMLQQMDLHERVAVGFLDGSLSVMVAEGDHEFILSDDPVFACIPTMDGVAPVGLGVPGVEVTMPISPKLCLMAVPSGTSEIRRIGADERTVSEVNLRSAFSARERFFAASSRPELLKLVERFPERSRPVTIEKVPNIFAFWCPLDHSLFSPISH